MAARYPAPFAAHIFSPQERLLRMRQATDAYAESAIAQQILGESQSWQDSTELLRLLREAQTPTPDEVAEAERRHGHEVVGFLEAYLSKLPEQLYPYIHYGLTSSDLTEFDLFVAITQHRDQLSYVLQSLVEVLAALHGRYNHQQRAGRTHGQTAELTTLGYQMQVHMVALDRLRQALEERDRIPVKSPGPTGRSTVRNAPYPSPFHVVPSTQVIPRDYLAEWALLYLRVANALNDLAVFVRLGCRSEIGEFTEGHAASRIGSSAMPAKRNPIDSEKVCGLARVARGHAFALSEITGLWEDRDLSNSSTERLSVPALAATVEHMVRAMVRVMTHLVVDTDRMTKNAEDPRTRANAIQNAIQREKMVGPLEAGRLASLAMMGDKNGTAQTSKQG